MSERHEALFTVSKTGFVIISRRPTEAPCFTRVKVHRDFHVEVARTL